MRERGFTRTELLVVLGIIAALVAYLIPVLHKARTGALSAVDATQIAQLHKANVIYSDCNIGRYMIPGLVKRLPITPEMLHHPPGMTPIAIGPEDHSLNTTPNMYSALIAQQFFGPELIVGPTEVNPNVRVKADYNHDAYAPANDSYWDDTFRVDIDKPGGEAHASYAHLAIGGLRKTNTWRVTHSGSEPVFSTRGPRDGAESGPAYDDSMTLKLHGPNDQWVGNVCFNDNHVDTLRSFYPLQTVYRPADDAPGVRDNMFHAEFNVQLDGACSQFTNSELAGDAFLLIYSDIEHWEPETEYKRCPKSFAGRYD